MNDSDINLNSSPHWFYFTYDFRRVLQCLLFPNLFCFVIQISFKKKIKSFCKFEKETLS